MNEHKPQDIEADEALLHQLESWQAPSVTSESTARLILRLNAEFTSKMVTHRPQPNVLRRAFWLIWIQTRVIGQTLWIASALVLLLGAGVTLALREVSLGALPFVLIAPIVGMTGITFIYSAFSEPITELELAAPISPRLLALSRLTLVFGFNLVFSVLCSIGLALIDSQITLIPLIEAWLTPMALLSALSFFLSVFALDPLISIAISLTLWAILCLRHYLTDRLPFLTGLPNLLEVQWHGVIWLIVIALVGLALSWIGREEHWLRSAR
ncbi:MAG: hypothetical protein MUF87_03030 [Anaerolineae bacterium]|jgi:hypothetical protein|nr:hypothetical protein [Anaerolineae bacterium]